MLSKTKKINIKLTHGKRIGMTVKGKKLTKHKDKFGTFFSWD